MAELQKIRIDKWLWAVRIYKSRSLAAEACGAGKIKIDGESVKAAHPLKVNTILIISKEGDKLKLNVIKLIDKRVSAPLATLCYEDITPPEEKDKLRFPGVFYEVRDKGSGRPTKKERREIDRFKEED